MMSCAVCEDVTLRALDEALAVDDLDHALTLGLLEARPEENTDPCEECRTRARIVIAARNERLRALAARERYRARQTRLAERAETRARNRKAATTSPSATTPSLPPAAAAALARAKVRAAAKPQPD
jgi:hypothetical protein